MAGVQEAGNELLVMSQEFVRLDVAAELDNAPSAAAQEGLSRSALPLGVPTHSTLIAGWALSAHSCRIAYRQKGWQYVYALDASSLRPIAALKHHTASMMYRLRRKPEGCINCLHALRSDVCSGPSINVGQ